MKRLLVVLLIIVAIGGGAYALGLGNVVGASKSSELKFRTAKVERGEVVEGVAASGTIQPIVLVQVGTQVSGVIEKIFKDFNSPVKAGETIATLDSRRLKAQLQQDMASMVRAKADATRVKAELYRAERELTRQKQLVERRLTSQTDYDAAVASVASLQAQVEVTAAQIEQAQSSIETSQINLGFATIVSPIDGVVVSRNVDVGQTVQASLSAPTLFVIANDLNKVQVQASVPEADIGRIKPGQATRFAVDAHPERTFDGKVSQVRLASIVTQNVVTYTVLIDAENPRGLLLPGMTANVTFEIARSPEDGLKVPSAALRLRPPDGSVIEAVTPTADAPPAEGEAGPGGGRRRQRPPVKIYVPTASGRLQAVLVKRGVSDGAFTSVTPLEEGALDEGKDVVTAIITEDGAEAAAMTNPFAPPRMGPGGRGAGGAGRGGGPR